MFSMPSARSISKSSANDCSETLDFCMGIADNGNGMSMIPAWNLHGVIPPFDPIDPTSTVRSPYIVALSDVVLRLAVTSERIEIMDGFLRYRQLLHAAGIVAGFQWLDGSFLEEVEMIRTLPPKDIDVTTFFYLPTGKTQRELVKNYPILLDTMAIKQQYHTDGFLVCLDPNSLEYCIRQANYWYGVWSHQRNTFRWKGFIQIDLNPQADVLATKMLDNQRTILEEEQNENT